MFYLYLPELEMLVQVFKSLYENASNSLHVGSHLAILAAIRDVCKLVHKEVTSWVCMPIKICILFLYQNDRNLAIAPVHYSRLYCCVCSYLPVLRLIDMYVIWLFYLPPKTKKKIFCMRMHHSVGSIILLVLQ